MERYTKRLEDGQAVMDCANCPESWNTNPGGKCTALYCRNRLKDRLAAIEDILGDEYDLEELRGMVQAKREGRCVVLDVKIGQKVWILDAGEYGDDDEAYPLDLNINGITLSDENEIYYFIESPLGMDIDPFSHKDIGKTVFLTRADAEAALRREQDGNNK